VNDPVVSAAVSFTIMRNPGTGMLQYD